MEMYDPVIGKTDREFKGTLILKNLIEQIINKRNNFTKQQKTFADFVLKHLNEIAFLNVAEVSKNSNVSGATIVRFCKTLGFKGYPEFKKKIRQSVQSDLTAFNRYRLRTFFGKNLTEDNKPKSMYHKLLQGEIENTATLLEGIDKQNYITALDLMAKADRFCVVGNLASTTLAMYLGLNLSKLNHHTDIITSSGISSYSAVEKLTPDSVVFLLSFPRYPKETLKIGRYAKKKGAHIISITDTPISPIAVLSDISFFLSLNLLPFGESYTGPIAFLTVLCAEYCSRLPNGTDQKLQKYDECAIDLEFF